MKSNRKQTEVKTNRKPTGVKANRKQGAGKANRKQVSFRVLVHPHWAVSPGADTNLTCQVGFSSKVFPI